MKIQLALAASGLTLGGLYAGGAFKTGELYDLPVAQVRSELAAMPLPREVLRAAGASDQIPVKMDFGDEWISWSFKGSEGAMSSFTARFRQEAEGKTRVWLHHSVQAADRGMVSRLTSTRFMRGYATASFEEQVDARLDGRSFDYSKAMQVFARRSTEDPEQVRELGLAVRDMYVEAGERAAEAAHGTGNSYPTDGKAAMEAATRPSVDLSE